MGKNRDEGRRRFLTRLGRGIALGGIGAVAGGLLGRAVIRGSEAGQTCVSPETGCRGCPALGGCILPPASSARRVLGGK